MFNSAISAFCPYTMHIALSYKVVGQSWGLVQSPNLTNNAGAPFICGNPGLP